MTRRAPAGERRITEGGRLLRIYLDTLGMSVPDFCALHKLERIRVQRAINGQLWQRISIDFGLLIEKATDGGVPAWSFASSTARAVRLKGTAKRGR